MEVTLFVSVLFTFYANKIIRLINVLKGAVTVFSTEKKE